MRREDFIYTMESFVGISENPPGSNRTPLGEEYGWNGVSWCAIAVSVACRRLGYPLHEAAVARIKARAQAGDFGLRWTQIPERGAIVCYDWHGRGNWGDMHTGVLRDILVDNRFRAIEGNYRDRCEVVLRDMTHVMGFAVPPFDDVIPAPVPQPQPQPVPQGGSDLTEKLMNAPVLLEGSTDHHHVGIMQSLLTWHAADLVGDKNRFVDGVFGPMTTQVLIQWQRRTNSLKVDGVCGPSTWAWLCGV